MTGTAALALRLANARRDRRAIESAIDTAQANLEMLQQLKRDADILCDALTTLLEAPKPPDT